MGGSYKHCTDCGKRALSIATRCPGCGRELLTPADPKRSQRGLGTFRSPRVAAAILAAAAALTVAQLARTGGTPGGRSSILAAGSIAASSEVAYAVTPTARPEMATASTLPAGSARELLVARTWTSVRQSRSKSADLEAVLLPGDTVLADSLARGWYRVALEGEVLGYVHRSTLTLPGARAEPPTKAGRPGS